MTIASFPAALPLVGCNASRAVFLELWRLTASVLEAADGVGQQPHAPQESGALLLVDLLVVPHADGDGVGLPDVPVGVGLEGGDSYCTTGGGLRGETWKLFNSARLDEKKIGEKKERGKQSSHTNSEQVVCYSV